MTFIPYHGKIINELVNEALNKVGLKRNPRYLKYPKETRRQLYQAAVEVFERHGIDGRHSYGIPQAVRRQDRGRHKAPITLAKIKLADD